MADSRQAALTAPSPVLRARLTRGLGASTYSLGVVLITQVVTVPVFTRRLGVQVYGEWLVLSAVPTYLALSDLGFMTAASNSMTAAFAQGRRVEARSIMRSIWVLLTMVSAALFLGATLFGLSVNLKGILHLAEVDRSSTKLTFVILSLWTLLILQNAVPEAAWRAVDRYATGTAISATCRLLDFFAGVVTVLLTRQLWLVAAAQCATRTCTLMGNHLLLRHVTKDLSVGLKGADAKQIRKLANPALTFMLFPIGNLFSMQGIVIVVGSVLGPVAVVVVTTSRTLVNFLRQLFYLPGHTIWPELTRSLATGRLATARRLNELLLVTAAWGIGAVLPLIVLGGPALISLWATPAARPSYKLLSMLALSVWLEGIWWSASLTPTSINRHQRLAAAYASSCLASLAIIRILLPAIGVMAVAYGLLVIAAVMMIVSLRGASEVLVLPVRSLLSPVVNPVGPIRRLRANVTKISHGRPPVVSE